MNNINLNNYDIAAKICRKIYEELVEKIKSKSFLLVKDYCDWGTLRLKQECKKLNKREILSKIEYPISISLNNCVANYYYDPNEIGDDLKYNIIKDGDVIKIEMAVSVEGCIASYGETFKFGNESHCDSESEETKLLSKIQKKIISMIKPNETNDEIRIKIESMCSEKSYTCVENTVSYQHVDNDLYNDSSKYIILNYKPYYDEYDNLNVEPNTCFEFDEGEVYTINLRIVKDNENFECHKFKKIKSHIYKFNTYWENLRLKSSREFYIKVKSQHDNGYFYINQYNNEPKNRIGMKECLEKGILESHAILFERNECPVWSKVFTIIVLKKKCYLLEYTE